MISRYLHVGSVLCLAVAMLPMAGLAQNTDKQDMPDLVHAYVEEIRSQVKKGNMTGYDSLIRGEQSTIYGSILKYTKDPTAAIGVTQNAVDIGTWGSLSRTSPAYKSLSKSMLHVGTALAIIEALDALEKNDKNSTAHLSMLKAALAYVADKADVGVAGAAAGIIDFSLTVTGDLVMKNLQRDYWDAYFNYYNANYDWKRWVTLFETEGWQGVSRALDEFWEEGAGDIARGSHALGIKDKTGDLSDKKQNLGIREKFKLCYFRKVLLGPMKGHFAAVRRKEEKRIADQIKQLQKAVVTGKATLEGNAAVFYLDGKRAWDVEKKGMKIGFGNSKNSLIGMASVKSGSFKITMNNKDFFKLLAKVHVFMIHLDLEQPHRVEPLTIAIRPGGDISLLREGDNFSMQLNASVKVILGEVSPVVAPASLTVPAATKVDSVEAKLRRNVQKFLKEHAAYMQALESLGRDIKTGSAELEAGRYEAAEEQCSNLSWRYENLYGAREKLRVEPVDDEMDAGVAQKLWAQVEAADKEWSDALSKQSESLQELASGVEQLRKSLVKKIGVHEEACRKAWGSLISLKKKAEEYLSLRKAVLTLAKDGHKVLHNTFGAAPLKTWHKSTEWWKKTVAQAIEMHAEMDKCVGEAENLVLALKSHNEVLQELETVLSGEHPSGRSPGKQELDRIRFASLSDIPEADCRKALTELDQLCALGDRQVAMLKGILQALPTALEAEGKAEKLVSSLAATSAEMRLLLRPLSEPVDIDEYINYQASWPGLAKKFDITRDEIEKLIKESGWPSMATQFDALGWIREPACPSEIRNWDETKVDKSVHALGYIETQMENAMIWRTNVPVRISTSDFMQLGSKYLDLERTVSDTKNILDQKKKLLAQLKAGSLSYSQATAKDAETGRLVNDVRERIIGSGLTNFRPFYSRRSEELNREIGSIMGKMGKSMESTASIIIRMPGSGQKWAEAQFKFDDGFEDSATYQFVPGKERDVYTFDGPKSGKATITVEGYPPVTVPCILKPGKNILDVKVKPHEAVGSHRDK